MNFSKTKISRLFLLILIGIASFNSGCANNNGDIIVSAKLVEFTYYDVFEGNVMDYSKEIESQTIVEVINDWIQDMINLKVNYGTYKNNNNILEDLFIQNAFISDNNTLTLVFNESFLGFDNANTQPVYFLDGLTEILKQITDAESYSIEIENYARDIIHPDGLDIKSIPLK